MSASPRPRSFGPLWSIRRRIGLFYLGVTALLLGVSSLAAHLIVAQQLHAQGRDAVAELARQVAQLEVRREDVEELNLLGAPEDRIWILDSAGRVVAASGGAPGGDRAAVLAFVARERATGPVAVSEVPRPDEAGGSVIVLRNEEGLDRTLRTLRWTLLGVGLTGLVIAAGLGALVARRAFRPVERMRREVDAIPGDALERRIAEGRPDELGRLARSFNRLLERAERSAREQERFVADASHELKTPVTALEGHTRLVARALDRGDLAAARESAEIAHREGHRLALILRELLSLAEVGGGLDASLQVVRLDQAVAEACDELAAAHPYRTLKRRLMPASVIGDPGRLRELTLVLLDNAVKYSPQASPILIEVSDGERPVLSVSDAGPGMSDEDFAHASERFYRGSAATGIPGSGLGLAIALAICERHEAELRLEPSPEGGTRAVVCFASRRREASPHV